MAARAVFRRAMSSAAQNGAGAGAGAGAGESFIERAREKGVAALVGPFTHKVRTAAFRVGLFAYRRLHKGGYDSSIAGLRIDRVTPGTVHCSIEVQPALQNSYGTLHGGAIAMLVDVVGTLALLSNDATRPGVSVDIGVTYMAAAKAGDVVEIEGRVLKTGKKLGFTQVDFRRRGDGVHLASGKHTKAL